MNLSFLRNRVFWLHSGFWILYFTYRFLDIIPFLTSTEAAFILFIPGLFNILFSYSHAVWLLPFLTKKKLYFKYAIGVLTFLAIAMVSRSMVEYKLLYELLNRDYYEKLNALRILSTSWDLLSFATVISLLNFTIDRFRLEGQKKALENEKLNAELNYLKAQINPHFLFNTLHNLNYLTQVKSDQATEVIIKLSNIMRYMIYDSNKSEVALHREIDYIRDYLDLEGIRLNNQFDIEFDISEVNKEIEIAPLILIPFVENAFKHGVSDKYPDSWVKIKLSSTRDELVVNIKNSVFEPVQKEAEHSGFGLENVKKRLALSYPGKFELGVNNEVSQFEVNLKLRL